MEVEVDLDDEKMWELVERSFPIVSNKPFILKKNDIEDNVEELARLLVEKELFELVEDLIFEGIEEHLRQVIIPRFWKHFYGKSENDGFVKFKVSVQNLYDSYLGLLQIIQKVETMRSVCKIKRPIKGETNLLLALNVMVRGTLHSQLPIPRYHKIILDFYTLSFKVFYNSDKAHKELNESGEEGQICNGCSHSLETEPCICDSIIEDFHTINRILIRLELLERLTGEVLTSLIHKQIESHVQETCKGSYEMSFIAPLKEWLDTVVMGWLTRLYRSGPESSSTKNNFDTFEKKLHHLLYETYTRARIEQLFNIIIEYPDSNAAIEDLRICLEKTDLRSYLTAKLQNALQTRLLHPGVNTPDIITTYVASIRALRHLDPSGILLETVTQPVRHYLRGREDTMRCVVMSLTEDGPGELADELIRGDDSSTSSASSNWEEWEPDPIDTSIGGKFKQKGTEKERSWDIISMLVTVYGSKEMFVSEYRNLLADRLLQNNYNTEKEIRYLELLKLRFGDSQLHYCEVMLKDIYDSKRINTHLHSEPNFGLSQQEFSVSCMILSAQFWPLFKEETLELPEKIKEHLEVYTKAFETLKGNRTLNWKPHLGSINVDIELKGRTINITASPTHIAILWYFQEKAQWTVEELSTVLKVPPTVLRRRIAFWQSQGFLKEISTDTFVLVEESTKSTKAPMSEMMCEDDENESIMASAQDQREEELQVFWSYIVGMLTNLDSLPPERIHQMLKMFASQGPSGVECSLQQLRVFLDQKVREHQLLFSGGFYRLPK